MINDESNDDSLIEAKYRRAQSLLQGYATRSIVPNSTVYPIWIKGSDCFWYEHEINTNNSSTSNHTAVSGPLVKCYKEYRLVNAQKATNMAAFDHEILAIVLAEAVKQNVDKNRLPITDVQMQLEPSAKVGKESSAEQVKCVRFTAFDKAWIFEPPSGTLTRASEKTTCGKHLVSPNGKYTIFVQNYNLWLEDLTTSEEYALTHDGEELYCYAVTGNGWGVDMEIFPDVQARWSPDSKRIFTVQRDSRQVKPLHIIEHVPQDGSIRPKLHTFRTSMQGDDHVPEYKLVTIDVETRRLQSANYPRVPITRNSWGFFTSKLGWWGTDCQHAYFVDLARDYKTVKVVEFDTHSGATRELFKETSETQINLMLNADEYPTLIPLPETNELVWFSERSGWAHLYLYDLTTGKLKHSITSGEWLVRGILHVDLSRRELFIQTAGRSSNSSEPNKERDPYYRDLVRVNIDSGELTTLVSGNFDCATVTTLNLDFGSLTAISAGRRDIRDTRSVSHSGNYAVVTNSRADCLPVSLLLDRDGREVLELECTDLSAVYAQVSKDWRWPEPVKLLAADGKTDIYGLVFRPSDFSPKQSYPVISHTFNQPDMPWVPKGSFSNDARFGRIYADAAALAELGFIVVQIDGRGASYRHKAFQDASYGWIESAGNLEDHIAGLRQLAERYPYMDLDRVGIHSMVGGTGAVHGLFHYPDFYKVGVGSFLHDSRLFPATMWGDKYEGLRGPSSEHQYAESFAENLKGKLLIVQGMLDNNTLPSATFRVVDALYKANRDFDVLLLPNLGHVSMNSYVVRRFWDYLVQHLQDIEPPKGFKLITARDLS